MNIQSFLAKFGSSSSAVNSLRVVVQPNSLHFSDWSGGALPKQVPIANSDWQTTLVHSLQQAGLTDVTVDVVLNSNLYQNYQIDKPNVPQEELSLTLPFLLKDLITEKVTDIIADAIPLPTSNKLQVYVIPKSLVLGLVSKLAEIKSHLGCVFVEDDIWARVAQGSERFVLLQRSYGAGYKVSAFVDDRCVFQRGIRGVTPPLTGVATSGLQLDGIALELQRSIDYLSSQLRGATLHHMKVCCDDENNGELAKELDERLNVKVSALSETDTDSGSLLAQFVAEDIFSAINLYPQHLKPKVEHFTLNNVAIFSVLLFALLGSAFGYFAWQNSQYEQQLQVYRAQEKEFSQQLTSLSQRLGKHRPSPEKEHAVARLKEEIKSKQDSLAAVAKYDSEQQAGYSGVMQSLAKLGRNDISLSSIQMDADNLDIKGLARTPQAIPNWVNQFKSEINLVGRSFGKLKIARNEQNILTFELRTKEEEKE
ncbi:MSHA biogenesis protein MshI [Vibrio rhodolitus]|uniref:MSHA biogenesis protein MshI n=1 Tax=Vibrio rhodolitus TaxID=2231649 RepID=UPI000E0CBABF|nr:MSHA biogenesis protein MshI [Vibrio rhodolitus]